MEHAIAATIMILTALMQDVRGSGRKIQRMKQAAIGMIKHRPFGSVDGNGVSPRRRASISAETQFTCLFLDKAVGNGRNGGPSLKPSGNAKPEIANAPRNAPGSQQEGAKILDRKDHGG